MTRNCAITAGLLFASLAAAWAQLAFVPAGSTWRYMDNGNDQGAAWRSGGFNDSAWKVGVAQFGYGDGDEVTVVSFGPDPVNKYVTTYFRRAFGVTNTPAVSNLVLRVLADDGAVAYVNGTEVARVNMPVGAFITQSTLASLPVEDAWVEVSLSPSILVSGVNVLAIEVHQANASSSDLSFDAELIGMEGQGPPPPTPPTIVRQPESQSVPVGSNATFSVVATGTPPLFYRWRRNGFAFPGTNSSLTIQNVQSNHAGVFSVIVSNFAGAVISSNALLTVVNQATNAPPVSVLLSPTNGATFAAGASIDLQATASDPDGRVARVEFFANGTKVAEAVSAGDTFASVWSNAPSGSFQIVAHAIDDLGARSGSAAAGIVVGTTPPPSSDVVLVPRGGVWRYLDDGSDQGTAWRERLFTNEVSWPSGPAQLGFGDGDETTVLSSGSVTYYFRNTFQITNLLSAFTNFEARLLRDDGAVVYVNGVEVTRQNMPAGEITFQTLATANVSGPDETTMFYSTVVPPGLLVRGLNTIAVEVHQVNVNSSDVSFDFELRANSLGPVAPTINTHPQSQTVMAGSNVTFRVEAGGTEPLFYRWRRNGIFLDGTNQFGLILPNGATNSTLTILNVMTNAAGSYTVLVSNMAGMRLSAPAQLTVLTQPPNQPPVVSLIRPTNGANFGAGAPIILQATASDADGSVPIVEFFANGVKVADAASTTGNFGTVWSNAPAGTYQIVAEGVDNGGARGASAAVQITVGANTNLPPIVQLTSPTNGTSLPSGVPVVLRATASDPDGNVARVEFFAGTNRIAIALSAAGNFNTVWSNAPLGRFLITAVAVDNVGARTTSAAHEIFIGIDEEPPRLVLIPKGAAWRYLDDGSDQGSAWASPEFNDSSWSTGPAQLGFGDGDESTLLRFGAITYYFRKTFAVPPNAGLQNVVLSLLRDDGAVVYLNGVEITRQNMPAGPITYQSLATVAVGGPEESTLFITSPVPPSLLLPGVNTIAVEVHQVAFSSSDVSFDVELSAQTAAGVPPTFVRHPESQAVRPGSNVTFHVEVTGTEPLRYRWRRNGVFLDMATNLPLTLLNGATNATLTILNASTNAAGVYSVLVMNSAGTRLSSNAVLTIVPANRPPVAFDQSFAAPEDSSILITLASGDPDGSVLQYFVNGPSNGTVTPWTVPYQVLYTPDLNYHGPDSFTWRAFDGEFFSETATVSITLTPVNDEPVARLYVENAVTFLDALTVISTETASRRNNDDDDDDDDDDDGSGSRDTVLIVLDGSQSSDMDNDALQYLWTAGSPPVAFASGVRVTNEFGTGVHEIQLEVSDGLVVSVDRVTLYVLEPCDAIALMIMRIDDAPLRRQTKRALIKTLRTACEAIEDERTTRAVESLQMFQAKVAEHLAPTDPALAGALTEAAQTLMGVFNSQ